MPPSYPRPTPHFPLPPRTTSMQATNPATPTPLDAFDAFSPSRTPSERSTTPDLTAILPHRSISFQEFLATAPPTTGGATPELLRRIEATRRAARRRTAPAILLLPTSTTGFTAYKPYTPSTAQPPRPPRTPDRRGAGTQRSPSLASVHTFGEPGEPELDSGRSSEDDSRLASPTFSVRRKPCPRLSDEDLQRECLRANWLTPVEDSERSTWEALPCAALEPCCRVGRTGALSLGPVSVYPPEKVVRRGRADRWGFRREVVG